jgi:hypothetical protein
VPQGFAPTRARGEHAPGKQTNGVANGHKANGAHGHSETAPGRTGTSPGRTGTSPGKAGTSPGKSDTSPGRAGTTPGQTKSSPSHGANPQRTTERGSTNAGVSGGGSVNARGGGGAVDDVTSQVKGSAGRALDQ